MSLSLISRPSSPFVAHATSGPAMPLLLVQHRNATRAARLPARLLIGRGPMNHLVVDDPAVSRMHAWIDVRPADGRIVLTDMRSRTGTRANGVRLGPEPRVIAPGDTIEIGPARLTLLADGEPLPPGAERLNLPTEPSLLADLDGDAGIRFDCPHCRAPMWATAAFAGRGSVCAYCENGFTIPRPAPRENQNGGGGASRRREGPAAPPRARPANGNGGDGHYVNESSRAGTGATAVLAAPPPARPAARLAPTPVLVQPPNRAAAAAPAVLCGVCQSAVAADEEQTACPTCGLRFHADCWHENYGCSAYGCPQVNALAPPPPPADEASAADRVAMATAADVDAAAKPPVPWAFVLLAASVVGVLVSTFTFGAASLAALAVSVAYMARAGKRQTGKPHQADGGGGDSGGDARKARRVAAAAAGLSAVGLVAGAAVSYLLFVAGRR